MRALLTAPVLCLFVGAAPAQFGQYPVPNWGPGYRGNISPYLNILRGQNTGIDYYLGTRAEQQRRANAQEFRSELDTIPFRDRFASEDLPGNEPDRPIPSGANSVFNNTGGYFNNTTGAFAYPTRPPGPSTVRPGALAAPPRQAGTPPRSGANPGFAPRTGGGRR
jgi:hypothetical protein